MQPQQPMTLEAALEQAQSLLRTGQLHDAIAMYDQIIAAVPHIAEPYGSKSLALWEMERYDESVQAARAALNISENCATAYCALGLVEYRRNRPDAAIPHLRRAYEIKPDLVAAHNYCGLCHACLGEVDQAMARYEVALHFQPDHQHVRFNRALVHLSRGNYEEGWLEYEWRWRTGQLTRPAIPRPQWDGSHLAGRHILIHTEQGIGDTLQFVRLLPLLKRQGARITFACLKELRPLLTRCEGIDEWLPIDEPAEIRFDIYAPIVSLCGLLKINEKNMPRKVPYVLPDPERVAQWKPQLDAIEGFKIGLCWQGSKTFIGDIFRSIPLRHFAPLALPGVKLISLQKGYGVEQIASSGVPVVELPNLDSSGGAMMDTAAVMQHLDLVITSDTAIAHLAGAMGIPCWVALSTSSDWRWQRNREDNEWYPTLRVFRQKTLGDWPGVFAQMTEALKDRMTGKDVSPARPLPEIIRVPVPPGEVFDKITILQIKSDRIKDPAKLANIRTELAELTAVRDRGYPASAALDALVFDLRSINEKLWEIEDDIRDCERDKDFGPKFIELARAVYTTNDRRAAVKRSINDLLGSRLVEEKSYAKYD